MLKLLGCLAVALFVSIAAAVPAKAETRSLKLYFIHTKERAEITYKRNGRYDQRGLDQINRFLRDWRRNEPAKMDPRLLDLVWGVYKSVGARDYIHVVSAYRSPATNKALRGRSSGVAEKSQHMLGKAMDFYIPGVKLSTLRAAAFKAEGGGVGYYPKSGSPFVHLDVGNVRSWPRMSRPELMALFPDGKTIHVPTDGKPLPGFNQALAAYELRKRGGGDIQVASAGNSRSGSGRGLLATLFGGGGGADDEEDSSPAMAAAPSRAPTPAAAVPQQPAAQPEPQAETPETIIASLPARSVPLPGAAPRPMIDVGATASAPLIAGLPAAQVPPTADPLAVEAETEVALNVPLPTRRPNYTAEPMQVAAAEQPDLPISAIAPERRRAGSDAISDMLAMTASEARADVVINAPVPGLRPSEGMDVNDAMQVASVSPSEEASGDVFVLASLPTTAASRDEVTAVAPAERPSASSTQPARDGRMASLSASPRVAVIGRDAGADAASALESGVRTTAKSGKPRADEARRDPKSVLVPVEHDLTRWAFKREVTVETAGGTKQPAEAFDMVRTAPQAVYTAGFQQGAPTASADRFSGKAVTFMSVAKFATN